MASDRVSKKRQLAARADVSDVSTVNKMNGHWPRKFWRNILFVSVSVTIAAALNANIAGAQDSAPAPSAPPAAKSNGKEPKKNVVNFDDQLVEGQTQKPDLLYTLTQRNANFKRLIRLRDNFLPEMRATSEEIGRSGRAPRGSGSGQ